MYIRYFIEKKIFEKLNLYECYCILIIGTLFVIHVVVSHRMIIVLLDEQSYVKFFYPICYFVTFILFNISSPYPLLFKVLSFTFLFLFGVVYVFGSNNTYNNNEIIYKYINKLWKFLILTLSYFLLISVIFENIFIRFDEFNFLEPIINIRSYFPFSNDSIIIIE